MRLARALSLLLLAAAAAAAPLGGQTVPFGKNKIQYRNFDWRVISGEHVDVYYYPEEEEVARLALAYAEESYELLERKFRHHPFRRIPLIVYASDQDFEQTNIMPGFIPEGVLGFTEYLKRRVAMPFRGDYEQFRQTLRHELIHAFQISKLGEVEQQHPRVHRTSPQAIHWWTEGLAEFWSGEQTTEDDMFVRDVVLHSRLPSIEQFNAMYSYAAYPLGAELHKYLAGRFGEEYIAWVYENYWKYPSFEKTLEAALGVPLDRLSREWRYELERRYFPVHAERPPLDIRARVVAHKGGANFKPVLYLPPGDSVPDLLFLSPRDGYTNLYRTTLEAGEAGVRTVLKGERSAEFESFHAYSSRIDVNADGVVALVSRYMERDALLLWDLEARRLVGRYRWPDLVGLKSPAWSPDGSRVVFEGLSTSGFSDLYVLRFADGERAALTADRYRDEDPDWSPDGRTIVFSSDRTDLGAAGHTNLFLYDVASGDVRYLTYGAWHDQDPRWSSDGERIAFSSDRGGIYDLYAVDRAGTGRRLTAMAGGAFDPEWLPGDRGLVFAGYSGGAFSIYRYDLDADSARAPVVALDPAAGRAALGADSRTADASPARPIGWDWLGADAAAREATPRVYDKWSGFSLDFAGGDAMVTPGIGSAQGVQFLATDMLGDHVLFAGVSAVQARSIGDLVDNFSGQVTYLNLRHRLNYGAGLYRFKGLLRDVSWDVFQENSFGAFFIASYPFSKFRRLEFQLGVEKSARRDMSDIYNYGTLTGNTPIDDTRDLTRSGILTSNFVSYVKDNTLWIPTGPIDGERFNLTAGLVNCFDCSAPSRVTGAPVPRGAMTEHYLVVADYRKYVRTTLLSAYALRAYVYYSDGAIPGRAILGGPTRLRGYPRWSLAGSRVAFLNQEWRFPILHGVGLMFPFGRLNLPGVQGALFTDLGSSWVEGTEPKGAWGSYGLGLRMSLGYPFVLRLDTGRRFRLGEEPPVQFGGDRSFGSTFVDFFFGFNY